ncbi:MAG: quinol dehydrogenase ferredoxin subunit NapH [bacterium]|nr:quinol dehydrogenase ferredoxin subunit NapH [bacterium]
MTKGTRTPLSDLGKAAIEKKGWFEAYKWLIARRTSQIGILLLFLMGPIGGFWVLQGNLANSKFLGFIPLLDPIVFLQMLMGGLTGLTLTVFLGAAIITAFYALIGGRVFCSWACPVNIVTDTSRYLRRKLEIKGGAKLKRETRYFMLAAVLITAAMTGSLAYELVNPVSLTHRGIIFGFGLGWVALVGLFAFDLLFAKDGWCGHFCPMGALYGLIGSYSLIRVRADARDKCDDCMECYEVCPEMHVIPPALKSAKGEGPVILSSDCTNCGRCIDICDEGVYHYGIRFPNIAQEEKLKSGEKVFEDAA